MLSYNPRLNPVFGQMYRLSIVFLLHLEVSLRMQTSRTHLRSFSGITWLMGGNYDQVAFAVQNMIANLTGMICDGAKPSCALKVTTGVSTAVLSAMMAMEDRCVTSVEGIIDEDVDQSIRNLTRIGSQAMNETDKMVLDIMTHKGGC